MTPAKRGLDGVAFHVVCIELTYSAMSLMLWAYERTGSRGTEKAAGRINKRAKKNLILLAKARVVGREECTCEGTFKLPAPPNERGAALVYKPRPVRGRGFTYQPAQLKGVAWAE